METVKTIPGFRDFDAIDVCANLERAVLDETTLNFVIDFDNDKAYAAIDIDDNSLREYLAAKRAPKESTRWINIFAPDQQPSLVKQIARCYNFSPRLTGIMCATQHTPTAVGVHDPTSGMLLNGQPTRKRKSIEPRSVDLEMHKTGATSTSETLALLDFSHYKLVDEVWHHCSVDWDPRHLCIGYNSLPNAGRVRGEGAEEERKVGQIEDLGFSDEAASPIRPMGKRVWSWLILCDDGTVISISEDPFPGSRGNWSIEEKTALRVIRRNLLTVVRQLSKVKNEWRSGNPIQTLDIRPGMQPNPNSKVNLVDSSGLLFYYLFDDWYTTYALVAKKDQQYAARLQNLRSNMFNKPGIELIKSLHQTGRQLAVLKRMYQSYALIIRRILEKQKPFKEMAKAQLREDPTIFRVDEFDSTTSPQLTREPMSIDGRLSSASESFGAHLSQPAIVRFERLLDRINLYALSEIQECLDEKDALVFMNFNLIALKESNAIEKLTRITIILAKATILFLPVSLMTGYFSTQISDLQGVYTVKTYWACFAIIVGLSFLFLFGFGWISDNLEGKVIYRSLTRTLFDAGKQAYRLSSLGRKRSD